MKAELYDTYRKVEMSHWWFIGRRKIIFNLVDKYISDKKNAAIFDFGCNAGLLVGRLQEKGYEACGADISAEAIEYGKSRGIKNLAVYTEGTNPFPDKKFDLIVTLDVLEHIENDEAALVLLRSMLTENGRIIAMVPAFMFFWGLQDEVALHFRRYTKGTFKELCTKAGMTIERASYFNFFLFLPIYIVRLWQKVKKPQRSSDFDLNNGVVNWLLSKMFLFEAWLLKFVRFPFGVSFLAVIKKHDPKP